MEKNPLVYVGFNLPKQKKMSDEQVGAPCRSRPGRHASFEWQRVAAHVAKAENLRHGMSFDYTPEIEHTKNGHIYSRSHLFQGLSFWGPTTAVRWLGGSQDSWGWWQRS